MADYNNTIAFWKRKPREKDDPDKKYPNYNGKMTVDGKKKEVSLWINMTDPKERKEGEPDMNGKIQEPYKKENQ